ncbi:Hydrogen cyanide synthase subunit HcnC precursor [Corynebacterium ciconiae DSM 44920]|uniref:glycine oxidase ThiO n=1 Tax=Corynebacterium ciconiae TaxID=227319 RepID=UPI000363AE93|nr:glycine oxidase ThiO [Corynebacterium ciconiae]WKD61486.1 Hydrogen cyanide synthase subunit HcnC precursor [Corynebacterium ciconiae DSM 44920]
MAKVTIIGAGIVGLATAFSLTRRAHQVRLIDPSPASGATHYAGGMLAPVAEVQYRQEKLFPLMKDAARYWPELIAHLAEHTALPLGFDDSGTLVVAADHADGQHLEELALYQHAFAMPAERITTRQARTEEPALSPRLTGAVSIPGDFQIYPRVCAEALLDACRTLGVCHIAEAVTHLKAAERVTAIHTTESVYEVDEDEQVVLAAGLGAGEITGWDNPLQLRPVYGDILRVRVPAALQPLCTKVVRAFVEDRPVYIIPRAVDQTIAIGASTREDHLREPKVGAVYDLLRDAIRILPGLEECELIEAATGARPGSPDDLPYLGRARARNLIVSTGYFRHGILLSSWAARRTTELIEGLAPEDLQHCDPYRHERSHTL